MLITKEKWENRRKIVLQPHQKRLKAELSQMRFPFYVYWGMGSGKTLGGLVCLTSLRDGEKALVVCDKSIKEQWLGEVRRFFGCNYDDFADIGVRVEHYEHLDDENGAIPKQYSMVIVDEAHRFRNAWHKESARMLGWIARIKQCARVVYMSGTPIVHNAEVELHAFRAMMGEQSPLDGRISFYDPRDDAKREHHYAKVVDEVVRSPMSWAQCFKYMQHRRQTFTLQLDGESEVRMRQSSSRNTYNTLLRSICNCPFAENPALSSKMNVIVAQIQSRERDARQVVYSCRRDTGIDGLIGLYRERTRFSKTIFRIDGSMSAEDRANQVTKFNRCVQGVLFITDAGAQGIDCRRVAFVHIMEPADNLQEERQIINRAVRFKAHGKGHHEVIVKRYVSVFPVDARVSPPWKRTLFESGLFDREELEGITRRVQYALMRLIRDDEGGETIDEKTLRVREDTDIGVQHALRELQSRSLERATPTSGGQRIRERA
mgnify:CR=1 FL=1|tara:strand:+ start:1507 stop:2973 length:1467 start_codon:yes stop_codon:yes gene_type:complete